MTIFKPGAQQAIYFSICIVIGILTGKYLYSDADKVSNILQKIDKYYVNETDKKALEEHTVKSILEYLDPHSYYLSPELMKSEQEQMQGNFSGIGVQFKIIDDTICVLKVIKNGPSELVGIKAGDKLITVAGKPFTGDSINNEFAMAHLKGPEKTVVTAKFLRNGQVLDFSIERGTIPLKSIETASIVSEGIGYVKIDRFASQTYNEFMTAMKELNYDELNAIIIDVRNNPGGLMSSVTNICDELLEKGKMIVYTEGRTENTQYISTKDGNFKDLKIAVLVNENSASASEIIAGALQDNDKGVIIGRRTFGKGLVQRQFRLNDNSEIRLTIAKYYTPTGRCIQKDFKNNNESYYNEVFERFNNGELSSPDSIPVADSLKFYTPKGKLVFGGGGIVPDVFSAIDSNWLNTVYREIINTNLLDKYFLATVQAWNKNLPTDSISFAEEKLRNSSIEADFILFIENNSEIDVNAIEFKKCLPLLKNQLIGQILEVQFNAKGYYYSVLKEDAQVLKAIDILKH